MSGVALSHLYPAIERVALDVDREHAVSPGGIESTQHHYGDASRATAFADLLVYCRLQATRFDSASGNVDAIRAGVQVEVAPERWHTVIEFAPISVPGNVLRDVDAEHVASILPPRQVEAGVVESIVGWPAADLVAAAAVDRIVLPYGRVRAVASTRMYSAAGISKRARVTMVIAGRIPLA